MRRPQNSTALSAATLLLALPSVVSGVNLDCKDVRVDGKGYDFRELGGPRAVHWVQEQPPSILNTTFTIDICANLKVIKGIKPEDQCPTGTRVCGVTEAYNPADNTSSIYKVVPIAGNFASSSGGHLDPKWTKLRGSDSNADAEKEGLRLELKGGKYPFNKKKSTKQKALIEFICDRNRTGTEGTPLDERDTEEGSEEEEEEEKKRMRRLAKKLRVRADDDEEEDDDGDEDGDDDDDDGEKADKSKALQFVSYKEEDGLDVLRLTWYTKFACDDGGKSGSGSSKSEHWGFFTWIIIIVFLCTAAYLIFGSWLNYERYGARGWDAVPHGDTIRDLPYLIKDFGRRVTSSVQGGGSRGGYSAVSL